MVVRILDEKEQAMKTTEGKAFELEGTAMNRSWGGSMHRTFEEQ